MSFQIFLEATLFAKIKNNGEYITNIYSQSLNYLLSSSSTRYQTTLSNTSCKLWQFLLIYLNILYSKNPDSVISLISDTYQLDEKSKKIIELRSSVTSDIQDLSHSDHPLYQPIWLNNIKYNSDNWSFQEISSLDDLSSQMDLPNISIFPMVIGLNNIMEGGILHYFTLVLLEKTWYLNSAYGSDLVKSPQYTQLLDINRFDDFLSELSSKNQTRHLTDILYNYSHFFLDKTEVFYWTKDIVDEMMGNSDNWAKYTRQEKGSESEIEHIKKNILPNLNHLRILYMPNYLPIVNNLINP